MSLEAEPQTADPREIDIYLRLPYETVINELVRLQVRIDLLEERKERIVGALEQRQDEA